MISPKPKFIINEKIVCNELMFVQYMPIKLTGQNYYRIPPHLYCFTNLINNVVFDYIRSYSDFLDQNLYITAKHLYVNPNYCGNRAGWHIDGFGTSDINYIWTDKYPTEFCVQDFNLSDDCNQSMIDMQNQAKESNIVTFPENSLLRLDSTMVHRVPEMKESGLRTFVKLSFSESKYNLKGNAYNHLLNYDWEMVERKSGRNHPSGDR